MLDVHSHFLARSLPPPSERARAQGWPVVLSEGGWLRVLQREKLVRTVGREAWSAPHRLLAMDARGVRQQVVMPTPFTMLYDADAGVADEWSRAQNDALADIVADGDGRLHGLGTIPLQDPDAAVAEARRLMLDLGLDGVEIGTHAGDRSLHDARLEPVFDALDDLGAAVFVHPWKPLDPERTAHHGLAFGLARAVETELAAASLVMGGVLTHRSRMRVCLAHGGAGIPAVRGRIRDGWQRQPADERPPEDPDVVLRRLWVDGLTYDPHSLALAARTFGVDRLVLGTDFPFAAQEEPVGASIARAAAEGLVDLGESWADTTAANARRFLGVDAARTTADLTRAVVR